MKKLLIIVMLVFSFTITVKAQEMLGESKQFVINTLNSKNIFYNLGITESGTPYIITTGTFQSVYYFNEDGFCWLYVVFFDGAKRADIITSIKSQGYIRRSDNEYTSDGKKLKISYDDDMSCWYISVYYMD